MSDYDTTVDQQNMVCPYCKKADFQPEGEDYSEDSEVHQCGHCDMYYYGRQFFTIDHRAEPDCDLNNTSHTWKYYEHCDAEFCTVCGSINSEYARCKYERNKSDN